MKMIDIRETAKKMGLCLHKQIYLDVGNYGKASDVIAKISSFLKENDAVDADWEVSYERGYSDAIDSYARLTIYKDKTDDELIADIAAREKALELSKEHRRKEYERLKKEFSNE